MMSTVSRLKRVAKYPVAGLITAVVVAWALSVWPLGDWRSEYSAVRALDRFSTPGYAVIQFSEAFKESPAHELVSARRRDLSGDLALQQRGKQIGLRRPVLPVHHLHGRVRFWTFVDAGWPLPAFWGWRSVESRGGAEQGGLVFARPGAPVLRERAGIGVPVYPRWFGLCVNAALFAAVWWALARLRRASRWWWRWWRVWRRLRRWRGHLSSAGRCPECGYEVKNLQRCPECGVVVRA